MFKTTLIYVLVAISVALAAPAGDSISEPADSAMSPYGSTSSSRPVSSGVSSVGVENSFTSTAPSEAQTVPPASDDPNYSEWSQDTNVAVEAERGPLGATILTNEDIEIEQQNPDSVAPPTTDNGILPAAKWPMALSHNRLQTGGWARQQNEQVMPIATTMAGVQMRLEAGAIRELHWHTSVEWAYNTKGYTKVTAVNTDGQVYVDTVGPGDLWYFPAGIPHSLQATDQDPEGSEFLLVFNDGSFSEDSTFQLTDWTAHIPKEVLAKNFQTNISAFNHIPSEELYIFPSEPPAPNATAPTSPTGQVPMPFTFHLSQVAATPLSGGTIKIADTRNFPVSTEIVVAEVTVEPGAMRELHWHPTQAEWSYFIQGEARNTLFASSSLANTFDYRAGDVGYVPPSWGHYIENTGNDTLVYLEIFNSDLVQDISLQQWLALTPPVLVKAHLGVDDTFIDHLNKTKQYVVGPVAAGY